MSRPSAPAPTAVNAPSLWQLLVRFYRVFRLVALAALILVLLLILRTPAPPSVQTDPTAAARLEAKLARLQAAPPGQPKTLSVDEAELNSWLGPNLALAPPEDVEPSLAQVQSNVRDLKVSLIDDRARVFLVFDFHGKDLGFTLEGRLRVEQGYLRLDPTYAKLGSLPLPHSTLEGAVQRIFASPENQEQFRLPPEVLDIRVEGGKLLVFRR